MTTIYKYVINPNDPQVMLRDDAEVLSAGVQGGNITIWVRLDPEQVERVSLRRFNVYGTGHEIEGDPGRFVNTVFMGAFVFHVFEATS